MKIYLSIVLPFLLLSCVSSETRKPSGASDNAVNCFEDTSLTFTGNSDIAQPWKLGEEHSQRHTNIQRALAANSNAFRYCVEKEGELRGDFIFAVAQNGTFAVIDSSSDCFKTTIERIKAGKYNCQFPFSYKWNGNFPLINQHQIEFK